MKHTLCRRYSRLPSILEGRMSDRKSRQCMKSIPGLSLTALPATTLSPSLRPTASFLSLLLFSNGMRRKPFACFHTARKEKKESTYHARSAENAACTAAPAPYENALPPQPRCLRACNEAGDRNFLRSPFPGHTKEKGPGTCSSSVYRSA